MSDAKLLDEQTLLDRLQELEETLEAIRAGQVDAVVVDSPKGQQVYTLDSPDEPFRIFVEQMQEGALTVDGSGTIVYCNRFFANLLGRPLEHVQGQSIYDLLVDHDSREQFRVLLRSAAAGAAHGLCQLPSDSGELLPVQLACTRLPAEADNMFGVVVTDLAAHERAQRLEAERRAAEQARAARDQFLAIVSHELRTPLNAILGWTQVLTRHNDVPEPLRRGLEVIERNAWVQAQLIDDLLDVSKILAGKLRLDMRLVDLHAVLNAAVAAIQPSADAKGIKLRTGPKTDSIRVKGDPDRLQQMIGNLLSNAIRFTPERGEVQVLMRERGPFAEIEVSDTGIGIGPEFLPRLFELYRQEGATTQRSGGLGIGLAIVRQLTELHEGQVWAESEGKGRGAKFTIRLPLSAANIMIDAHQLGLEAAAISDLRGVRVLVVEDDSDSRDVIAQLLAGAGAQVATAANAAQALAILDHERVDLLVSDIGLPDIDGYELIRRVRAAGRSGKDMPAVALTSFAGREDRRQALLAGFQVHMSKPVDQEELYAVVSNLAGHSEFAAQIPVPEDHQI